MMDELIQALLAGLKQENDDPDAVDARAWERNALVEPESDLIPVVEDDMEPEPPRVGPGPVAVARAAKDLIGSITGKLRRKKGLEWGVKSVDEPTPPKVDEGSFFGRCERDEGGQCLPEGQVGSKPQPPDELKSPKVMPSPFEKESGPMTALGQEISDKTYFHGTWDEELRDFDPEKTTTGIVSFTDDEAYAEGFGKYIHKIELSVRNPIDLRSLGSGGESDEDDPGESLSAKEIQQYLVDEYDIHVNLGKKRGFMTALIRPVTKEIKRQAIKNGYDSILVLDFKDREVEEVQVFHKDQIKVRS